MRFWIATICTIGLISFVACDSTRPEPEGESSAAVNIAVPAGWDTAVEPKPISNQVRKGLDWLIDRQLPNGGWGQGEESKRMGGGDALRSQPNVADTCMATLSLIRSGRSATTDKVKSARDRALDYICLEISKAPADGLAITDVTGTRVQSKIGRHVDTFLASLVLAEMKDRTGDADRNRRVLTALDKVMDKMEKNQGADGTWERQGWAPVLSQGLAGKAVNLAVQNGVTVSTVVLERAQTQASAKPVAKSGASRETGLRDAGIDLYRDASNFQTLNNSFATNLVTVGKWARVLDDQDSTDVEIAKAHRELKRLKTSKKQLERARGSMLKKLEDPAYVQGFGSNGGEEFLSYMQISEGLVLQADDVWRRWDSAVADNLNRVQNKDGSWSGHHCITGRTFCTSAALLTLLADRTRFPEHVLANAGSQLEGKLGSNPVDGGGPGSGRR